MRQQIVAGNWKMNKLFSEADDLLFSLKEELDKKSSKNVDVIVCPPFLYIELARDIAEDSKILVGAQNVSKFDDGAFTGDVSASMLQSMEVEYCIVGHSERRKYYSETNEEIAIKVNKLLEFDISPIVCCGEILLEREQGLQFKVVEKQLTESLFHLSKEEFSNIILAYEPVWAIGTGKTASAAQAQEMHAFLRSLVKKKYGQNAAQNLSILYGGSCNAANAKELFANIDVDGGLIGGASLKAEDFIKIVNSF